MRSYRSYLIQHSRSLTFRTMLHLSLTKRQRNMQVEFICHGRNPTFKFKKKPNHDQSPSQTLFGLVPHPPSPSSPLPPFPPHTSVCGGRILIDGKSYALLIATVTTDNRALWHELPSQSNSVMTANTTKINFADKLVHVRVHRTMCMSRR